MDIYLDKRTVKQIRVSATDAIEDGDYESLKEDLIQAFSEDQIEEIESRVNTADFYDFVSEVLDEWSGEDEDEIFELLEAQFMEAGINFKYRESDYEDDDDDDDDEEEESDDALEEVEEIEEESVSTDLDFVDDEL